jgi:hypothetical protein
MKRLGTKTPQRGELSPNAKLTEAAVQHIRTSAETAYKLARTYGVSHTAIRLVRARETWAHLR